MHSDQEMRRSFAVLLFCILVTLPLAESTARQYKWIVKNGFTPPKGYPKQSIMINDQSPGPTLTAHRGDHLIVEVTNGLAEENIAIQWIGVRPIGGGLTGLIRIPPGQTFTYRFVVDRLGTYAYYSRYKMQRDAGLQGSIRVLPPDEGQGVPFKEGADDEAGNLPSQFKESGQIKGSDRP